MKLRSQLLTLSLATLLVPWFGWKLVQELEQFLRAGQESTLLAAARTVARALPIEYQSELLFGRERVLPLRAMQAQPYLDGYSDDWPEAGQTTVFESADAAFRMELMGALFDRQLYLFADITDPTPVRQTLPGTADIPAANPSDGLLLFLRSSRGLVSFRIHTAAPGPLNLSSQNEGGGQLEAYWLDVPGGYRIEIALPISSDLVDLSIGAIDQRSPRTGQQAGGQPDAQQAGTLADGLPSTWLSLSRENEGLKFWLAGVTPPGARSWVLDHGAWVMAGSGEAPKPHGRELSFAERLLYRVVAGSRTEVREARPGQVVRFDEPLVQSALQGRESQHWGQDLESAQVRNSVAVPVVIQGRVSGAVVMEASTDGMLLVTNRALGRLLLSTLLLTFGLAAGLWYFATRLSRRVQRLSSAVSEAMDESGKPRALPLVEDTDELGELARNNARLLRAVADYTSYLQKLAGRLSHELKTPLAITRSSLDNLASHELDSEARKYVERSREGMDRLAAIVRAMSEASQLESAVKSTDWETVDLVKVIGHCVDAYQSVYPGRHIGFEKGGGDFSITCAPDLLAQALDKLVENAVSLSSTEDRVTVGLARTAEDIRLTVRNTGSSLPDVLPDQLFDSLVSIRESGGGRHLGLGLHIVRLVAEAHGGVVRASNLEGGAGVEFCLVLPLAD